MKQYVIMTIGFTEPTEEIMTAWKHWFKSIEKNIVDQVGLRNGKEVTPSGGPDDLPLDESAITGYLIINAKDDAEAELIAQSCPMVTSTRVYEVMKQK